MGGYWIGTGQDVFGAARACFGAEITWLDSEASGWDHAALERVMQEGGGELQRLLLQADLDVPAAGEVRLPVVVGADGAERRWAAHGRHTGPAHRVPGHPAAVGTTGRTGRRAGRGEQVADQIERISAHAQARGLCVPIVIDVVHVTEYVWKAAWCFFAEGDPAAEQWAGAMMRSVLDGHALRVATIIRLKADDLELPADKRTQVDTTANCLRAKAPYPDYPTAWAKGRPIATGVIEAAARHLVADRMDITGARRSQTGAQAVLRRRALVANGDFDAYWDCHPTREFARIHASRYIKHQIPI